MLTKVKIINTNQIWDAKRRYKINDVVSHLGVVYQNTTGRNSSPSLGSDWIFVKNAETKLSAQIDLEANGVDNFIDIGTSQKVNSVFYRSTLQEKKYWSQNGSIINFTFIPEAATPGTSNLQFI